MELVGQAVEEFVPGPAARAVLRPAGFAPRCPVGKRVTGPERLRDDRHPVPGMLRRTARPVAPVTSLLSDHHEQEAR